jgi:hypothetical protein
VLLLAGAFLAAVAAVPTPAAALDTPLRINSRRSLRVQFGYSPRYARNLPSFDARNRASIRSRTAAQDQTKYVFTARGGALRRSSIQIAVRHAYPGFRGFVNAGGWAGEVVEADAAGRLYTLVQVRLRNGSLRNLLLYSVSVGRSWRLVRLPFTPPRASPDRRNDGTSASEHLVGWNLRSEPPLIAVWRPVADWPGVRACRMALYVVQPRFEDGRLRLSEPTLVSDRCLGLIQAAGGASFAATVGTTSYVVWAEVAPPGALSGPTYVAAYDQLTGVLGTPVLVATARPANDDHTTPGIVADSRGVLHVVTGGHNTPFLHTHTVNPEDLSAWTKPEQVLTTGYVTPGMHNTGRSRQTYVSLVCTPDDALVIAFRQWRQGVDTAFNGLGYQALCVQRLEPDGAWSEAQRIAFGRLNRGYAQYYQKLTVDRLGRLYLSFSYFRPHDWPRDRRIQNRYRHRLLLISTDGGTRWRFATRRDLLTTTEEL